MHNRAVAGACRGASPPPAALDPDVYLVGRAAE
jgi:hypothetical protein